MRKFLDRVHYALSGWLQFFRTEKNGQIQMLAAVLVVIVGLWLGISAVEWMAVAFCIGAVLALEMVNSAIETLCNLVQPEKDVRIKFIKDVAAGAVLWMVCMAIIVGVAIFLPKIWALLLRP
ncbi:MAG: diacylglycerol kinase family protein [Bacteroidetes bacterium]|nr:MAG: diacylglycerol kinase family protein [Bacteroidota bacterium]